jgi:hypothetical protein
MASPPSELQCAIEALQKYPATNVWVSSMRLAAAMIMSPLTLSCSVKSRDS